MSIEISTQRSEASLSVDTHCAMLAGYMSDRMKDMHDAFRQFLQFYSAILGGSLLLKLQYRANDVQPLAGYLDALLILAAAVATIVMSENARAWRGYRIRLHELAGRDMDGNDIIPKPKGRASGIAYVFGVTVWIASLGLIYFNPLR
jgi:hypothetical protein